MENLPQENPLQQLYQLLRDGKYSEVARQGKALLNDLLLEDPHYIEFVIVTAWGLWRSGRQSEVFDLIEDPVVLGTQSGLELLAYVCAYPKSGHRKYDDPETDFGLKQVVEKLGPDNIVGANAQLIYDLNLNPNERPKLTYEDIERIVITFSESKAAPNQLANVLQNAALWVEKHEKFEPDLLEKGVEWLKMAIDKYDPIRDAHHQAGLYYRLYLLYLTLKEKTKALDAIRYSVEAWDRAVEQDPDNGEFQGKQITNLQLRDGLAEELKDKS